MNRHEIFNNIISKKSFLCIGLDTDINKIPKHLLSYEDPVFEFNKEIIDSTIDLTVAYKVNTGFYESRGIKGWISLEKTFKYLNKFKNQIFTIADAKRGDIGNTSEQYAKAFFDFNFSGFDFDAVTVVPYMGKDSVKPFLSFKDKWVILLALTSKKGSDDFQNLELKDKKKLFEIVISKSSKWGNEDNMMFVVGATKTEEFRKIRNIIPNHFLLVPGVGTQKGNLYEVAKYGMNKQCGLLINASRSIIYASNNIDFAEKSRKQALKIQQEMKEILKNL
jgi:orotidine-5'-phosphate decarboxylase